MSRKPSFWVAVALALVAAFLGAGAIRADEFEDGLLKQYRKQSAGEALELKREVAAALARADAQHAASAETVKALRASLARLREDSQLPRVERTALIRQVQERLHGLAVLAAEKERLAAERAPQTTSSTKRPAQKDEAAPRVSPTREYARSYERPPLASRSREYAQSYRAAQGGGPDLGGGAPLGFDVTPVVSADRRFVRVNISGTFNFFRPGPWTPVQIVVPTLLYGPNGPVAVRPIKIVQIMLP